MGCVVFGHFEVLFTGFLLHVQLMFASFRPLEDGRTDCSHGLRF